VDDYRSYGLDAAEPNLFYIWFIKPFLGGPGLTPKTETR